MITKEMLKRLNMFSDISGEVLENIYLRLRISAIERAFKPGEIIAYPGQPARFVHLVLSGRVTSNTYSLEGREMHMAHFGGLSNQMFFFVTCFSNAPIRSYYLAVEESHLLLIRKEDIIALMDDIPEFRWAVIVDFCCTMQSRLEHLYNLDYKKVKQKICAYLLTQSTRASVMSGEFLVMLPFNQEQFALYLNVTRPVLSKELHRLQDSGYIRLMGRRKILICDVEQMQQILNG